MATRVVGATGCKLNDARSAAAVCIVALRLTVVIGATVRGRNAIGPQFFFGFLRHPVGGPCWCQLRFNFAINAMRLQQVVHVVFNLPHGGAAAVGGRNDHFQLLSAIVCNNIPNITQDAQLAQRDDRNFWIG